MWGWFIKELPYWLVLNRMPGFGPQRFAALHQEEKSLSNCFSGEQLTTAFREWCKRHGIHNPQLDWRGVEKDLAWQSRNTHILTWLQTAFPPLLKNIHSAPPVLFVKGQPAVLSLPQIAMVGSRQASLQGKENAKQFAMTLVEQGLVVTSGLALGIDAASHEGALQASGITVAVLGNGLDSIYPRSHSALAEKIAVEGALLSEFPIGTLPKPGHFPRRNRVISGLSLGVLVVESTLKSGSLITASYALEQGREIFAIPGSIHNPMAKGCHHLLRAGAKCVENVTHILEELSLHQKVTPKKSIQLTQIEAEQGELLAHIFEECTPIDSIVSKTGLTAKEVSSMLLELELRGIVTAVPGGYIRVATGD